MSGFYVLFATDKPGVLTRREETRPLHRAYLDDPGPHAVKVLQGGPTLDHEGRMNGTLLVLEADSMAAVEAFAADDPYARAGIFQDVRIRPWNWSRGAPASGRQA